MTIGALLSCDSSLEPMFREHLSRLPVNGYLLTTQIVSKNGIAAMDVTISMSDEEQPTRHLRDILAIIEASELSQRVKARASAIFTRLADAEATIHGTTRDHVHFHEVGAVDAIIDIVGTCILLELLEVDCMSVSSIPCGRGTVLCQHGRMPMPAPATIELLRGFTLQAVPVEGELVTPTGAAIVAALCDTHTSGTMPSMTLIRSGFGAGKQVFGWDVPNMLRVLIGDVTDKTAGEHGSNIETITILETNVDDQTPEIIAAALEQCFKAGALDVTLTPITMKKSRQGTAICVICPFDKADAVVEHLFRSVGTFGIRRREQVRYALDRTLELVSTRYGDVRLKLGKLGQEVVTVSPEYEDCRQRAAEHGVSLRRVYEAAQYAFNISS